MILYQASDRAHFTVTVLSREEAIRQADSFGKDTCVISITTPGKTNVSFPCDTLHEAFYDTTESIGISIADAVQIRDFVTQELVKGIKHLVVHCDAGVSRSAGVAAAILKATGRDESEILDNPNYFINARCYAYVLMAFGIDVTKEDITTARERSKKAYLSNWP